MRGNDIPNRDPRAGCFESVIGNVQAFELVSQNQTETIYNSPPSEPDDDLWLAHGAKILEESVPSLRSAASELIKALLITACECSKPK